MPSLLTTQAQLRPPPSPRPTPSPPLLPAEIVRGPGPLITAAIHNGHALRPEVAASMALGDVERLREEDIYSACWTVLANTRVIGLVSRFEVDLNRPREGAIYLTPQQAWGLNVWHQSPPREMIEHSLARYDAFYDELRRLLDEKRDECGRLVMFDLHTYNHRRDGPDAPPADPQGNPEINLGTGDMPQRWRGVADRFISDMRACRRANGEPLDVRENVRFRGGHFARWIHHSYPDDVCCLAIEVKKFFMDEWTGRPDAGEIEAVGAALASAADGVLEALEAA